MIVVDYIKYWNCLVFYLRIMNVVRSVYVGKVGNERNYILRNG